MKFSLFYIYIYRESERERERELMMRETQGNYYLVLFMFISQLYFYILGPSGLLGY